MSSPETFDRGLRRRVAAGPGRWLCRPEARTQHAPGRGAMKWILIGLAVLVGLMVLVTVIGAFLPRDHTASRSLVLHQPPNTVWATIRDLEGAAAWWSQSEVKAEVVEG